MTLGILSRIVAEVTNESLRRDVDQNLRPVQAAEFEIAVGGDDSYFTAGIFHDGKVQRSTAQVVNENLLIDCQLSKRKALVP